MKAVVLAAGEGVRMRPLTMTRSKHMIPLAGKPLLGHVLEALRFSGFRDVLLVVGYKSELVRSYFGDGSALGLNLGYVVQRKPSGTAEALGLARSFVGGDDFLMLYGDLLFTGSVISSILKGYRRTGAPLISVVPVEHPERYGVVKVEKGLVKDIVEKPRSEEIASNTINAGIYIFGSEIFRLVARTSASPRGEFELTDTVRLLLEKGELVVAHPVDPHDWFDVGRPWDLLEANRRVLLGMDLEVRGTVEDGAQLRGAVGLAEGARIRSGAYVEGPIFIDSGSDIGPNCYVRPHTSIGRNVRIGNACEIKNSIVMSGTHIAHLSYVGDSVIGEDCNFGAGTITANLRLDEKTVKVLVKDELVDSGRTKLGVIMGDRVKTAINVNFMPGVKVGLNSWIGPNVTVTRDVPSGSFILERREAEHRRVSA
jgi:bifunctional UDP-N-acetylglucosamine pyrophosphorylase/glucosamine-1-phosphate N-acetyltransferase